MEARASGWREGWCLPPAWEAVAEFRRQTKRIGQILSALVADSLRLIDAEERFDLDDLHAQAARMPVAYLGTPPGPALVGAVEVRNQILGRSATRGRRGRQGPSRLTGVRTAGNHPESGTRRSVEAGP